MVLDYYVVIARRDDGLSFSSPRPRVRRQPVGIQRKRHRAIVAKQRTGIFAHPVTHEWSSRYRSPAKNATLGGLTRNRHVGSPFRRG